MNLFFKLKRKVLQSVLFSYPLKYWQKYGINVTRNHYYSNIPDLNKLPEEVFSKKSELIGINLNIDKQKELLHDFSNRFRLEYDAWPAVAVNYYDFQLAQSSFTCIDAVVLHCMIRHFKPSKVVEVGSGYSTMITAKALLLNKSEMGRNFDFTAVEPYPNESIRKGIPGLNKVLVKAVQEVDLSLFTSLKENDVLFLDSTHTVKINGDVNFEILEILPRLNKGVIVHIHDIFLPYEYPEKFIKEGERMWLEQYLLQAFLCNNSNYEIVWTSHYMHREHHSFLIQNMKNFEAGNPFKSSIWLKKIA